MAGAELIKLAPRASLEQIIRVVNSLVESSLGTLGARQQFKGYDGAEMDPNTGLPVGTGRFALVVQSSANHVQVRNAADNADVMTVTDSAVSSNVLGNFNAGLGTTSLSATSVATTTLTVGGLPQAKTALRANASLTLAITTVAADVPGCSLSLTPGHWLVECSFDLFINGAGDLNQIFQCYIVTVGGTATILNPLSTVTTSPVQPVRNTISRSWIVQVTATTTVKMQAVKSGGAGASSIEAFSHIQATNA